MTGRPRPQLYAMAFTRQQLADLAGLEGRRGPLGRLGERFRKRADYIDFAASLYCSQALSVGKSEKSYAQHERERVGDLDQDWKV